MILSRNETRKKRKVRIRKRLSGTAERPRLVVYRSNLNMYAQIVDDTTGTTLVSASTLCLRKNGVEAKRNKEGAQLVGKEVARLALEKDIRQVVFDRNGYLYHGRIKALAEGAREGGLEF